MNSQVLIVSHDAGGAEVLSSWVLHHPECSFQFLLEGVATKVFQRKLGEVIILSRAEAWVDNFCPDLVLTGTSWASTLEKEAIAYYRSREIQVATFLEHWTRYRERFTLNGSWVLPNEVWVGDEFAEAFARKELPDATLVRKTNHYLADLVKEVHQASVSFGLGKSGELDRDSQTEPNVLYVTEPTSLVAQELTGNPRGFNYTEFEALDAFLKHLEGLSGWKGKVRLRPHPSEPQGKYDAICHASPLFSAIEISQNASLVQDCSWADWIVGCNSMVMAIGAEAGKQVFCSIPAQGRPSDIPDDRIVRLFRPI